MILLTSDVLGNIIPEMWEAMRKAKLGWASRGGDENVNALYDRIKELTNKEAAVLVPSGTMANLVAIMTHTNGRGDQVILEAQSHIVCSEEWGISFIAHMFPKLIPGNKGIISPVSIIEAIEDYPFNHKPRTALLCLENTHMCAGGTIYTPELTMENCKVAHERKVAVHLDGARLFNAAVALNIKAESLVKDVDSVMISLNKGLSAPEGALLCGTKEFIDEAKINLKRLGGNSIHKAGIIAAAGLVALSDKNIARLSEDHRRAKIFAEAVSLIEGVKIDLSTVQSNIVLVDISSSGMDTDTVLQSLVEHNISGLKKNQKVIRFTFHNGISDNDTVVVVDAFKKVLRK
jgi:threonine aldolase